MDEDSGATQTDLTPQSNEPPTEGGSALGKAADMGHNLKESASKAKDIIGSAAGGGGDGLSGGGLGGAVGKGLERTIWRKIRRWIDGRYKGPREFKQAKYTVLCLRA